MASQLWLVMVMVCNYRCIRFGGSGERSKEKRRGGARGDEDGFGGDRWCWRFRQYSPFYDMSGPG